MLSESFKKRSQLLAGIISEADMATKTKLLAKSGERVAFSADMMKQAIEQGREIGILYKGEEMPVQKYRVVRPVVMGTNSKGNKVVRGLHVIGQSEKAAKKTGVRSAEAENDWRMFRADRIKGMWFTDRFFSDNITGYNPNDKDIKSVEATYKPNIAKNYQSNLTDKPIPTPDEEESREDQNQFSQEPTRVPKKTPTVTDENPGEPASNVTPDNPEVSPEAPKTTPQEPVNMINPEPVEPVEPVQPDVQEEPEMISEPEEVPEDEPVAETQQWRRTKNRSRRRWGWF